MPFLYYFFAVGAWIKGLFEAMVGVPLWALAHIHIDGDGLPGTFALSGYFMIMEIFLRPILIVFGLLASITIFSAQVRVLHDIWSLVTTNLTGFNEGLAATSTAPAGSTGTLSQFRDKIDQFFFTVIYAIIVYMLGTSSFKLITHIPAKVMRWMGANVEAFNDNAEEVAQGLMGKMTAVGSIMSNQIGQAWSGSENALKQGEAGSSQVSQARGDGPSSGIGGGLATDAKTLIK
jgi:hypothetical protein